MADKIKSRKWGGSRPGAGRPKTKVRAKPAALQAKTKVPHRPLPAVPAQPKAAPSPISVSMMQAVIDESRRRAEERDARTKNPFVKPHFPPEAIPPTKDLQMAMDANLDWANGEWATAVLDGITAEGMTFLGYPYLSELAQRPEYRIISETIADDSTRKWIDFEIVGEKSDQDDQRRREEKDPVGEAERMADPDERKKRVAAAGKMDKVKALKDDQERLDVRGAFYQLLRNDGFFGRSHPFLEFGGVDEGPDLKSPIGDGRDAMSRGKVSKANPLTAIKVIEPIWCYPTLYNATNPLRKDWYNPQQWYVMGQEVHCTRMPAFVGHPVPDILKPAYAFGGLSLSQMAKPYVDIWLTTRQSVADLIHSFSVMVLMTDLQTLLQSGGDASSLIARVEMFNAMRDNQGTFLLNKATEDFKNVSASIAGLHELQAQAQEHMASVARIPLVKFTGIAPSGLNATADGEIQVYDDTIMANQERTMRRPLTRITNFEQLSLWGEIDPQITIKFEPLRVMTEKERADLQKAKAERDEKYYNMGALAPEEIRQAIINDPDLPYADLDPEDLPDPPGGNLEDDGGGPGGDGPGGEQSDRRAPATPGEEAGAQDAMDPFFVARDEWRESEHPRAPDGKFGSGPGGPAALKPSSLKRVGKQMGSNPGGVFEDAQGARFYVKKGQSKAHVRNELLAGALYALAGSPTLRYVPVEGGEHVATEMAKLDKDRASKLSPEEREKAYEDFAVHAWLANYDAVGTGGDNLGTVGGVPTALDLGGALQYRAQGKPKGESFGNSVKEIDTMRDPSISPDAAAFFGKMTAEQIRKSAEKVLAIRDGQIRAAVKDFGEPESLADKLIARKADIAERFGLAMDEAKFDESKHPRDPDGKFATGSSGGSEGETEGGTTAKPGESVPAGVKKKGAFGGLFKTSGSSPGQNYNLTVNDYLAKPPKKGSHYRNMLAHLIENAGNYGYTTKVNALKKHLAVAFMNAHEDLIKQAAHADNDKDAGALLKKAEAAAAKAENLEPGISKVMSAAKPSATAEVAAQAMKENPKLAEAVAKSNENAAWEAAQNKIVAAGSNATPAEVWKKMDKDEQNAVLKTHGNIQEAFNKTWGYPSAAPAPQATEAELKKAAKATTLPIKNSDPETVAAIKAFNEKYAGKTITDPVALNQKVADYKETMKISLAGELKMQAKAEQQAAEAAKKEAEELAKAAGDPETAHHYAVLASIAGNSSNAKTYLDYAQQKIDAAKLTGKIKASEAAMIVAYSGSHYGPVNAQLRAGVMTEQQYKYAKALDNALDKLPPHTKPTYRKASLTPEQAAVYKVGYVVPERGFTSTSKDQGVWSGSYQYVVHGKTGRDISKLSNHPGEHEVLFKSNTHFKVVKVEGKNIHLEEMD